MRAICNTVNLDDYSEIQEGVTIAQQATAAMSNYGVHIVIPHEHRWWEYGTAIQMLLNRYRGRITNVEVLDIGPGWGILGPALQWKFDTSVTEYQPIDPDHDYVGDRVRCNEVLRTDFGRKGMDQQLVAMEDMPDKQFDLVACLSVMEHVNKDTEWQCWKNIASRVKPGGLLFVSTDVVEEHRTRPYQFDNLRTQPNYLLSDMKSRVEMLENECGMTVLGGKDWTWHGNLVFDYTFFRVGLQKGEL